MRWPKRIVVTMRDESRTIGANGGNEHVYINADDGTTGAVANVQRVYVLAPTKKKRAKKRSKRP